VACTCLRSLIKTIQYFGVVPQKELDRREGCDGAAHVASIYRPACDDNLDWAGSTVTRVRHFFIALIAARWGIMRVILLLLDVDWVGRDEMKLAYVHHR